MDKKRCEICGSETDLKEDKFGLTRIVDSLRLRNNYLEYHPWNNLRLHTSKKFYICRRCEYSALLNIPYAIKAAENSVEFFRSLLTLLRNIQQLLILEDYTDAFGDYSEIIKIVYSNDLHIYKSWHLHPHKRHLYSERVTNRVVFCKYHESNLQFTFVIPYKVVICSFVEWTPYRCFERREGEAHSELKDTVTYQQTIGMLEYLVNNNFKVLGTMSELSTYSLKGILIDNVLLYPLYKVSDINLHTNQFVALARLTDKVVAFKKILQEGGEYVQ